jgi:hypothetical protein
MPSLDNQDLLQEIYDLYWSPPSVDQETQLVLDTRTVAGATIRRLEAALDVHILDPVAVEELNAWLLDPHTSLAQKETLVALLKKQATLVSKEAKDTAGFFLDVFTGSEPGTVHTPFVSAVEQNSGSENLRRAMDAVMDRLETALATHGLPKHLADYLTRFRISTATSDTQQVRLGMLESLQCLWENVSEAERLIERLKLDWRSIMDGSQSGIYPLVCFMTGSARSIAGPTTFLGHRIRQTRLHVCLADAEFWALSCG